MHNRSDLLTTHHIFSSPFSLIIDETKQNRQNMQNEQAHEPFESIKPTKPTTRCVSSSLPALGARHTRQICHLHRMSRESKDDVDKIEIDVVIHRADESSSGEASQLRQASAMRSIGKACVAMLGLSAFFIAAELAFGYDAIHNYRDLFAASQSAGHASSMPVFVNLGHYGMSTATVEVQADATVADVFVSLASSHGLSPTAFELIFQGEPLEPGVLLSDAGICQEATLVARPFRGFDTVRSSGVNFERGPNAAAFENGSVANYAVVSGDVPIVRLKVGERCSEYDESWKLGIKMKDEVIDEVAGRRIGGRRTLWSAVGFPQGASFFKQGDEIELKVEYNDDKKVETFSVTKNRGPPEVTMLSDVTDMEVGEGDWEFVVFRNRYGMPIGRTVLYLI